MVSGDGEHVYQETPPAYTWIGKVHPLSLQYSFGVMKLIPRWRLSAAAATCVREPCMVSGDGEHVSGDTISIHMDW